MRRLAFVLLATLVGCASPERDGGANATVDAAMPPTPLDASSGDAPVSPSDIERTPFTTTGSTPAGSLDDVHFMSVEYVGGHCPGTYYLKLYRTDAPEDQPVVTFDVTIPWTAARPVTGTLMANAYAGATTTDAVRFEIVQLDSPHPDDEGPQPATVRIAGRFTINAPGWNVDFNVDATTLHKICLIL